MTDLTVFHLDGAPLRASMLDGDPWFLGRDGCRFLKIGNASMALGRLPANERKDGVSITDPMGRPQAATFISEAGLFRLIFESRKPEAERFKTWVFATVLPEIRRTGRFGGAKAKSELDSVLALARSCELVRRTHGRAAAQLMWAEMGGMPLPIDDDGAGKRHPKAAQAQKAKGVRTTHAPHSPRPVSPAKAASDARPLQVVLRFIGDRCDVEASASVHACALYAGYRAWAATVKKPAMSGVKFGLTMRGTDFERVNEGRGRSYLGLRLKADDRREGDA